MEAVQRSASRDAIDSELGQEGGEAISVEAADDLVPEFIGRFGDV